MPTSFRPHVRVRTGITHRRPTRTAARLTSLPAAAPSATLLSLLLALALVLAPGAVTYHGLPQAQAQTATPEIRDPDATLPLAQADPATPPTADQGDDDDEDDDADADDDDAAMDDDLVTPPGLPPGVTFGDDAPRPGFGTRIGGDTISLRFPNNPITDLLAIYENLTNRTVLKDTTIFDGASISLVTPSPVTRAEAISLIEASLMINGYAVIPAPDGRSVRVLPARARDLPSSAFADGGSFYEAASELPQGDGVISFFMQLQYLDPNQAAETLSNHIGLNPYGRITPISNPPGLLITENAGVVRQLVRIQSVMDRPSEAATTVTEFIELRYADSATVAQIVNSTLEARAQQEEAIGRTIRGESPAAGGEEQQQRQLQQAQQQIQALQQALRGRGQEDNGATSPQPSAQVIADTRLNRILVIATQPDFYYIEDLVRQFDQPVRVEAPYERRLRYVFAFDVLPVVADLLLTGSGGTVTLPDGTTVTQEEQPIVSSSVAALTGRTTEGSQAEITGTDAGGRLDQILAPEADNSPVSVFIGKTRVIADPQANTIIVIGPVEDAEKIDALLNTLDRKPPQVYLATIIGQLTLGDGLEFGIDYIQQFRNFDQRNPGVATSLIGTRGELTGAIEDMRSNLLTAPIGPAPGFNLYGVLGQELDAYVSALERTNRFKIISRPSVFALNNKKAVLTSGRRIPVPVSTVTNVQQGGANPNITTNIDFEDVVLKLEVVPLINENREITLTIAQVNDTVVGEQQVAENLVPIIGTENLTTTITVADRSTVVLGGLISEESSTETRGVPVISRIPIIGNAFKETVDRRERKELIIFIQPMVVSDGEEAIRASYVEDRRTNIGSDAADTFPSPPDVTSPINLEEIERYAPQESENFGHGRPVRQILPALPARTPQPDPRFQAPPYGP